MFCWVQFRRVMSYRLFKLIDSRLCLVLPISALLVIGGCGDFFAQKPTELQAKSILSDLSRIQTVPDANIQPPEIYKSPPRIADEVIDGKKEARVFYFCRYHRAEELATLVREQFAFVVRPQKNQPPYPNPLYSVSSNSATNQLLVRCPSRQEAEQILQFLETVDVPPTQVKIDCLVSELYADVTLDWETTLKIENLLGERIALGGKEVDGVLLPAFPGASLRDQARELIGLKVGYSRNLGVTGHEFRVLVDLLVSQGYLKILMNPTLEVVNGKTARIEAKDYVPLPKEVVVPDIAPYVTTTYEWVIDSLEITPYVFADGYIGLETAALIGSKSTPEGVKQIPIITERGIQNKENRIRQGESLIIGGIRKSEKRSVVRGVPFLKDIPVLGILFSSKDFEERAKEVIFVITPTISTGGVKNAEMVEQIREKHAVPEYKASLQQTLTDPFGVGAYTEHVEHQAARAAFERLKSDIEKAEALEEVSQIRKKLLDAAEQVLAEKAKAEEARAEAEAAKQEAEKAKADAEKLKGEAEKGEAEAVKSENSIQNR